MPSNAIYVPMCELDRYKLAYHLKRESCTHPWVNSVRVVYRVVLIHMWDLSKELIYLKTGLWTAYNVVTNSSLLNFSETGENWLNS